MKNQVNLIGNVGGEVTVKEIGKSKSKVAEFSLATSKSWKNTDGEKQEKTEWHSIVVWGKKAEIAEKYIKKGDQLALSGELEYSTFDAKEGHKVNVTKINVNEITLLSNK